MLSLLMIPTLIGVSLIVTALMRLLPGDAVDILVTENAVGGGNATFNLLIDDQMEKMGVDLETATFQDRLAAETELINAYLIERGKDPATAGSAERLQAKNAMALQAFKDDIRAKLGIDKNYIEQWWNWVWHAARGDLGESIVGGVKVRDELQRRIPASFQLGLFAMIFGTLVAIPVGVVSAVKQDAWMDYGGRSVAIAMLALPSFFIATLVIAAGGRWWNYSPPIFYKDLWDDPSANLQLVVVPAIILGFALSGTLMRLTRAQMLEVLR
jgi:ABC-type dipeptide/oligopeptide/nickel transport system permease component